MTEEQWEAYKGVIDANIDKVHPSLLPFSEDNRAFLRRVTIAQNSQGHVQIMPVRDIPNYYTIIGSGGEICFLVDGMKSATTLWGAEVIASSWATMARRNIPLPVPTSTTSMKP